MVVSTVAITDCSTMTTSHSSGSILIAQSVLLGVDSVEFFFVKPENHVTVVIYIHNEGSHSLHSKIMLPAFDMVSIMLICLNFFLAGEAGVSSLIA
jgi:hypothetical protein